MAKADTKPTNASPPKNPQVIVAVVIALLVFIATTSLLNAQNRLLREQQTVTPTPTPTARPLPTNTPRPFPTVKANRPVTFPSITIPATAPQNTDLQNKDELVICFYDDKCGGKKETTKEDCNATLCCPIGGEYKIASVNDCYAEQNRLLKEAYTQALKENNLVAEEEYRKLVEQVNQQATSLDEQQRLIAETKQQLLQICRENVLSMYPESINGESPERRNARFQAMNSCFNKYGQ